MCLELKSNKTKVKIAKNDIVVYKVLEQLEDGSYLTPYQHYSIEIGKTYESDLIKECNNDEINIGLHSLKTFKDAKIECDDWRCDDFVICECIIPKGAKYYEGTFSTLYLSSYVSNQLKYVKIIMI